MFFHFFSLVPAYLWVERRIIAFVSCPINTYLFFSEEKKMGVLSLVKVHIKEDMLEFMYVDLSPLSVRNYH